ncbi:sulfate transporter family-domain-containing protein [Gaertneriomyces semiglobifer]|nr:sulfate transporter family-domain-containing protein [Gaertneriomyces semiglobifer]
MAFKIQPQIDNSELKRYIRGARSVKRKLPSHAVDYVRTLFPVLSWIKRYNLQWLLGDAIAGFTVGFLVVPQALAQAKIATLPIEYGLYTAFAGLVVYAFFATTKDATIGPTAVLSLFTSQVLASANKHDDGTDKYPPVLFAITLAFFTGVYELIVGLLRVGHIVDFIPGTVISGFTTGAATTIIIQQLPKLLGIKGIDTNSQPAQLILRDVFHKLGETKLDAAWGFSSIAFLVFFKWIKDRYGKRSKWAHYGGLSRNGIALVLFILLSFIVVKASPGGKVKYSLVGNLPAGFKKPSVPDLSTDLVKETWKPALTVALVGIVEHIAIAKSLARTGGYERNVNPNQEIVALGLTNILGSMLHGYPATGSFSRSAVKAASGVRSPAAGWITGLIVVFALYVVTPVFYYIPEAMLTGVIMAAMGDMIVPYPGWIAMWNTSIFDFLVGVISLLVTILVGIEPGIYSSVGVAAALLLIRIARPKLIIRDNRESGCTSDTSTPSSRRSSVGGPLAPTLTPIYTLEDLPSSTLLVQFTQSLTYPNTHYLQHVISDHVVGQFAFTGQARPASERLWCDDTEEKAHALQKKASEAEILPVHSGNLQRVGKRPPLHHVILDLSAVAFLDSAGYSMLLSLHSQLKQYTGKVPRMHFVASQDNPEVLRNVHRFLRQTVTDADLIQFVHATISEAIRAVASGHQPQRLKEPRLMRRTLFGHRADFLHCDAVKY